MAVDLLNGLVAHYPLDNVNDAHTNALHLTNNNTVTFGTGHVGDDADFERSSSQSLSVADTGVLYLGGGTKFALSFWVKPESLGNDHCVISKWTHGSQAEWLVRLHSTGDVYMLVAPTLGYGGGGYAFTTSALISTGTYFHVLCQFDGTQATDATKSRIWINGSQQTLSFGDTQPTSFQDGTADLVLGRPLGNPISGWYYDGRLDEVGIWGRALNSDEIAALYSGLVYPFSTGNRRRRLLLAS